MITKRQILSNLSKDQLLGVASNHEIDLPRGLKNDEIVDSLSRKHSVQLETILTRDLFSREDLKKLCRKLDLGIKQKEFIEFALSKYIETGVEELDQEKLPVLLTNLYHSLEDAKDAIGEVKEIGKLFIEFQQYLYNMKVA